MTEKLKSLFELLNGTTHTYSPKMDISQVVGITGRPPHEPKKMYNKGSMYHK